MWGFLITNMGCLDLDCRVFHWGHGVPCQYVGLPSGGVGFPIKDMGTLMGGDSHMQAPAGVQVLMSATQSTYVEDEGIYRFHMEHPVPAYLVALVAGDLQPADIGPRYSHCQCLLLPPPPGARASGRFRPSQGMQPVSDPTLGTSPAPTLLPWPTAALPGSSPPTCPRPVSPSCALFQPGPLPGTHRILTLPEAHAGRFLPLKTKGTKWPLSVWLCPCHRRACLRLSTEVGWQAWARPAGPDKAWVVFEPRSRGRAWWVSGTGEP